MVPLLREERRFFRKFFLTTALLLFKISPKENPLYNIIENTFSFKKNGFQIIVANRREDYESDGTQVAWLLKLNDEPKMYLGKPAIANAILESIEHTP